MTTTRDAKIDSRLAVEVSGDLAAVEADWARLEEDGLLTPFQTRAWLVPFYRELAPRLKATPLFIVVRDKASGEPMLLLPLCTRRSWGVRIVRFADLGVSDYNAPILAKGFAPTLEQWRGLWRGIMAAIGFGAVIRFQNMPRMIAGRINPLTLDDRLLAPMEIASWGFALPTSAAAYRTRILASSFVKEMAKKSRRVAKRGEVEFVPATTLEDRRLAFDILTRQRQERCAEMGRMNMLSIDAYHRFYQAAVVESEDGHARLFLLKVAGEVVGVIFALVHDNAFHVIMSTFEGGDWKSCSLGNVLIMTSIEHCIAQGFAFYDLTIGNEGYKQHFGATPMPLYSVLRPLIPFGAPIASALTFAFAVRKTFRTWFEHEKPRRADPFAAE